MSSYPKYIKLIGIREVREYFKNLLEKGNNCGIIRIGYNCNAL